MARKLFRIKPVQPKFRDGMFTLKEELGRLCEVVCPGPKIQCNNCTFNSATNKSGKYKTDGPRPFTSGPCPICKGVGEIEQEGRHLIRFQIKRNIKPSVLYGNSLVTTPATIIRIKGEVAEMAPLLNMKYIDVDVESNPGFTERCTALTQPELTGSIVPGEYFIMYLQRISAQ